MGGSTSWRKSAGSKRGPGSRPTWRAPARLVLPRDVSLTGSATADVEVHGEIASPTVNIRVLGSMVRLGSAPSVNVAAAAIYAAGRVDLDSLSMRSDAGAIDVHGTLALTAAGATRGRRLACRIENLDVDRLLDAASCLSAY